MNIGQYSRAQQPHRKVLILGAGLSGIVAGKTLLDNGIDDFLILEGQDYIGGRIKQGTFSGFNIEEGANWIHSSNDDETKHIWKLKEDEDIAGEWTNYFDFIIRNEKGEDVTKTEDIQNLQQCLNQINVDDDQGDISARDGLRNLGWDPSTPAQMALDYLFTNYEYGRNPENFSFEDFYIPNNEFFISDQRGVMALFSSVVSKFESKIRLKKGVEKIAYSATSVEVTTSDGDVYTSDYVICTFSTGVLASNMVKFLPPLPKWKQDAISQAPMTVYTKIFLKFDEKFWDNNEYMLLASKKRGFYPVFQNLESPGKFPKGSGMLLITVTEDEGRRIEKQPFEETQAEIVKILRGVYGPDVPEPTDIFYPRWSTNPFIRGAFSEPLVGRTDQQAEDLSKNVENLYFAGEATSEWHGYMQGAYLSGEEKAKIIAKLIQCSDSDFQCLQTILNSNLMN